MLSKQASQKLLDAGFHPKQVELINSSPSLSREVNKFVAAGGIFEVDEGNGAGYKVPRRADGTIDSENLGGTITFGRDKPREISELAHEIGHATGAHRLTQDAKDYRTVGEYLYDSGMTEYDALKLQYDTYKEFGNAALSNDSELKAALKTTQNFYETKFKTQLEQFKAKEEDSNIATYYIEHEDASRYGEPYYVAYTMQFVEANAKYLPNFRIENFPHMSRDDRRELANFIIKYGLKHKDKNSWVDVYDNERPDTISGQVNNYRLLGKSIITSHNEQGHTIIETRQYKDFNDKNGLYDFDGSYTASVEERDSRNNIISTRSKVSVVKKSYNNDNITYSSDITIYDENKKVISKVREVRETRTTTQGTKTFYLNRSIDDIDDKGRVIYTTVNSILVDENRNTLHEVTSRIIYGDKPGEEISETTTTNYTNGERITTISNGKIHTVTVVTTKYERDANGNYDFKNGKASSVTTETTTTDAKGNKTTITTVTDANGNPVSTKTEGEVTDDNGNTRQQVTSTTFGDNGKTVTTTVETDHATGRQTIIVADDTNHTKTVINKQYERGADGKFDFDDGGYSYSTTVSHYDEHGNVVDENNASGTVPPGGTGGNADGTGGNADGTGGNADGTGGNADGTGGNADGTGGNADGTGGNADGTGGNADGTGGNADGTGGNTDGTGGNADGTGADSDGGGTCGVGGAVIGGILGYRFGGPVGGAIGAAVGATASCGRLPPWFPPIPPLSLDPLALDLNGDGRISTLPLARGAYFDLDNNGFAEKTAWVGPEDGLLVLDRNGNGQIDGGAETFGNETRLTNGEMAAHGFEALADFDGNGDGHIDRNDDVYAHLRVWRDVNGDGMSTPNELKSLDYYDIAQLDLAYTGDKPERDANGVELHETGSYQTFAGNSGLLRTLWFETHKVDSVAVAVRHDGGAVPAELNHLPTAPGFGNVDALHRAMLKDADLRALVERFSVEADAGTRYALSEAILRRWAQTGDIGGLRGEMDAGELATLESFWGQQAPRAEPVGDYALRLHAAYEDLHRHVHGLLSLQTHYRDYYQLIGFSGEEGGNWQGDYRQFAATVAADYADGKLDDSVLGDLLTSIQGLDPDDKRHLHNAVHDLNAAATLLPESRRTDFLSIVWRGDDNIRLADDETDINTYAGNDKVQGNARDNQLEGGAGNDRIDGNDGNDLLDGGSGDDHMEGGRGNDTYRFSGDFGKDFIRNIDNDAGRQDTLEFRDLRQEDVSIRRYHDDLIIRDHGGKKQVIVQNHFLEDGDSIWRIDRIRFADGRELDGAALKRLAQIGTDSDDYLVAHSQGSTLRGKGGNDALIGKEGNDNLYGGDGNDRIVGDAGNDFADGGAGNDNIYGGSGNDDLRGGDGNDAISGDDGDDTIDGGPGNDSLEGGQGNDIYRFSGNFGQDSIRNDDGDAGRRDILEFTDLRQEDVYITRNMDDLIIKDRHSDNQVRVGFHFSEGYVPWRIDGIRFADGSELDVGALKQLVQQGTDGSDYLVANREGSELHGHNGDDALIGKESNDNLYGEDGNDRIVGNAGDDFADGGAGNDNIYGGSGNDDLRGGDGNDAISGDDGDDTIDGGPGNDSLEGGQGNDIYRFSGNFGQDSIRNDDGDAGRRDILEFTDLRQEDVYITRNMDDLIIKDRHSDNQVRVGFHFSEGYVPWRIDGIRFADGSSLDYEAINALVRAPASTNTPLPAISQDHYMAEAARQAQVMTQAMTVSGTQQSLDDLMPTAQQAAMPPLLIPSTL